MYFVLSINVKKQKRRLDRVQRNSSNVFTEHRNKDFVSFLKRTHIRLEFRFSVIYSILYITMLKIL